MKQCGMRTEDFTVEAVNRGAWQAGGFPVEVPAFWTPHAQGRAPQPSGDFASKVHPTIPW